MARPQNRKRHHADEASQDDRPTKTRKRDESLRSEHPAKRPRRDQTVGDTSPAESVNPPTVEHHGPWQYPPEFWDRLSTIPLIGEALEELDRRARTRPSLPPPPPPPTGLVQDLAPTPTTTRPLARFARHGGPDLYDLRGYPAPAARNHRPASAMSSSSPSRATRSTDPTTVTTKSGTTKSRKSITPYNRGFEQHLTDHAIHPDWKSQEPGLEGVKSALGVPRPSLSPSRFSDSAFKTFRQNDAQAKDEDDVKLYVVPTITGAKHINHPSATNTQFANLEPLTDGTIAPAQPDMYYGAYPEQLDRSIRDDLGHHIIPSTMLDKPMAPNFFLKAKGPNGSLAVATRQARYDGAVGTRAMHSLQNYGAEEPVYDGKPYTFSSIYHGGTLKMYAHHATAPTTPGGRPEYHMTQLRTISMTDTRETFVDGATAFRNARDLAKQHRDTFIQAANARARGSCQDYPVSAAELQREEGSSPGEFVDCEEYPEDDNQDESQASLPYDEEPEASLATSFTSSFTSGSHSYKGRSKRRNSQSPPSSSHHPKKHHHTHSRGGKKYQSQPAGSRKGKAKAYSSNAGEVQENKT